MSDVQVANGGGADIELTEPSMSSSGNKRLSVERIYQKKTQLEHILIRPDTYIGSVERTTTLMWVFCKETRTMVQKEITYTPGLYKIYDEILVNAADNKQRDPTMNCIKIDIKPEENLIKIWNNGAGIPVVHHKVENMFVPSLIFGHLLTSSNYDDSQKKVTGGRNGFGAKLCNIFSKKFVVETSSKENKKCFRQTWLENMTKTAEPKIKVSTGDDFTCVTFEPDLARFGMTELDADTVSLFERRAYDVAASTHGVKVILNGERIPIKNFKDYVEFYLKDKGEDGAVVPLVYESVNPRWEVAIAPSSSGFQQVSFVNSIATTKGGKHVDYIADQVANKLCEIVKKKTDKSGVLIKPFQVRAHMWLFINCLIVNPAFDSQTKEFMNLQAKSFGSTCQLNEQFITKVSKSGIVESVLSWVRYKAQEKMDKTCHKSKHSKLKGIPKLDDANDAGTKNSQQCTLILTEGDSAKSLAVAGLSVVGRDRFGVFPLRGKLLNVRDAPTKQIMENAEINNLIKILGLQYKQKYDAPDALTKLRYGKIMIMTDQDQDGSHIKGLLISFIHHNWPMLLRQNFLEQFITPIVKVFKGKNELAFYSLPEFEEWQKATPNWHTWRVKYYKGLGTSSSKEAKQYFSDMVRHRIRFRYSGNEDDDGIALAFNKNKIGERKQWLTSWMDDRKRRAELGLPEDYLYGSGTHSVTYRDFIHKELVLFSNMDNERSIPSMVDGLKPGQRKVLFACFKRNQVKEVKVAQLVGAVAEMSAYHHGEMSLMGTIIGLAQDFVGANNMNLLLPIGQFGTRLLGGKDAASARYIFTALNQVTRKIFHENDDPILKYLYDDNKKIEPSWYIPIIPMVLVNGAEGIGTGWSTKIPNFSINDVISNLRRMMDGVDPLPMLPNYRGFRGTIRMLEENRYVIFGEIAILGDNVVEISELPVKTWTQNYKENVLEPMLNGSDKVPISITDYKEYHTDATVRFEVTMVPAKFQEATRIGLHKYFKLLVPLTTNSMVLFDHQGSLKSYTSVTDIFKDFYELRLEWYEKRKTYMVGSLSAEAQRLENQARFVMEKINGEISIENKSKKDLLKLLRDKKYAPDPVRAWKECVDKLAAIEELESAQREAGVNVEDEGEQATAVADYNYILGMPLWSLSKEKKDDLLAQRDKKRQELQLLIGKSAKRLWSEDLDELELAIEQFEDERQKDLMHMLQETDMKLAKQAGTTGKGRAIKGRETVNMKKTMPDPLGQRVECVVDEAMLKMAADGAKVKGSRKTKKPADEGGGDAFEDDFLNDLDDDTQFGGSAPAPLWNRLSGVGMSNTIKAAIAPKHGEATAGRGRGKVTRIRNTVKKSPVKKAQKKRKAFRGSSSEEDISDASVGSQVSFKVENDFVPTRDVASRRTVATKKYVFDSDEEENEASEEDVFKEIDHGQGSKKLDIPSVTPSPVKLIVDEGVKEGSSNPTTGWPIGYSRSAAPMNDSAAAMKPKPARGRGAAASSLRGGATRKVTVAPPKKMKVINSDEDLSDADDASDIFRSGPTTVRMNPMRSGPAKSQYVFDSASDDDDLNGGANDSDDSFRASRKPAAGKRRRAVDSDDDFDPSQM